MEKRSRRASNFCTSQAFLTTTRPQSTMIGRLKCRRIARMAARAAVQAVYLFHWRSEEARQLIEPLRKAGITVYYQPETRPGARNILRNGVQVIVIDLSRLPSHGGAVAAWIRGTRSLRHLPILFVNGESEKVKGIVAKIPDAIHATTRNVATMVHKAAKLQPANPVIPPQMMQSERSTAEKLGIKQQSRIALIDAPRNYARILGPLPQNVEFEEEAHNGCAITLWFIRDAHEYESALTRNRQLALHSKLWMIWPKGRRGGLNSNFIREKALQVGLVDYKICSLNEQWSGILFAVKKA